MPLTPDFEHDIFVNDGHLDDESVSGMACGWVITLASDLKSRVD